MADNKTLETGVDTDAVRVERVEEEVAAQVAPAREPDADTVQVHETAVALDVQITDPSSPLAVQVPEAGRGSLDLPAHKLDAPTPEQALSGEDVSTTESADDADDVVANEA